MWARLYPHELADRGRGLNPGQLGGGTATPHITLTARTTLDWPRVFQALTEDATQLAHAMSSEQRNELPKLGVEDDNRALSERDTASPSANSTGKQPPAS
jgi:hypothetical protein